MVAGAFSLTGCAGVTEDGSLGAGAEAAVSENSLTLNSLTLNSLTLNSLLNSSLSLSSFSTGSLATALEDPASRTVLKYIVSCALPANVNFDITVDGVDYPYSGGLGLAKQWAKDKCDDTCAQAISSCVLARLNYLGEVVSISERGAGLGTTPAELSAYQQLDGTYYGNIFAVPQIRYACLPPGVTELTRVCGPSLDGCGVVSQGNCADVCDKAKPDGTYPRCTATGDNTHYDSPITVFLQ
jgi:hypothetical protein